MRTLTIELPPEVEATLREAADQRGETPADYAVRALRERLDADQFAAAQKEERRRRVRAIAGKYAHLTRGVDEFLREKGEEARREAERDQRGRQDSGR